MKFTFLGTAAAEGVPAVFCNCPVCERARARGGKEIRTRSQILIDDDILFDFPMDTYMHMLMHNIDLSRVTRVLITHAHMDHCYPQEFIMRGEPFARNLSAPRVSVFCNSTVRDMFIADTSREIRPEIAATIDVVALKPFASVERDGTRIIALPAEHTKGEECFVYYVERDGKGAILMNDTGVIEKDVYARLLDMGARVNFAAFDCTYGARRRGKGRHMGLYDIVDQLDIINGIGLFAPNAKVYATHFSHNCEQDFEGMERAAAPYGISIAYDGCKVEV